MPKEKQELFKYDSDFYDVRFEESETVKQYKLKKRYVKIFSFLVFILVMILLYFVIFSDFANITNVYIKNERLVSEEEILELSGLKDYPNTYFTFKSQIRSKLKTNQYIKDVDIDKKGKRIYLTIIETKPLLRVGDQYLFDNNLIFAGEFSDVVPTYHGDVMILEKVEFQEELNALYLDSYENYSRISEIIFNPHALNQKELRLIMRDGNTVIVTYDDFAYKMGYYVDILVNINERLPNSNGIIDLVATIDCNEGCNYEFKPY